MMGEAALVGRRVRLDPGSSRPRVSPGQQAGIGNEHLQSPQNCTLAFPCTYLHFIVVYVTSPQLCLPYLQLWFFSI